MTDNDRRKRGRDILQGGSILRLSASPDGSDAREYLIISYSGAGGSAVCYEATELGSNKTGILKELYPAGAEYSFTRKANLVLIPQYGTDRRFAEMRNDYTAPYRLLDSTDSHDPARRLLKNYIQDSTVLYDGDGDELSTVYIWTTGFAGETLEGYFDSLKNAPLIPERKKLLGILEALRSVISGLTALHTNGFMHLDVKPSNILVHYDGEGAPNPANISFFDIDCLYAFGKPVPRGLGTEGYRAPELMRGAAFNRSDVYSAGAMLFAAVTGKLYEPAFFDSISEKLMASPLLGGMLSGSANSLTARLSELLHKCLSVRPDDRYRGCSRLNDDIARLIALCSRKTPEPRRKISGCECLDPNAVIQKLLYKRPLYCCLSPDKKDINVTVIGSDQFAMLFIDNALQSGQMKDRSIHIRVLCSDPGQTRRDYLAMRQALPRFVSTDGEKDDPKLYGSIGFEAFPKGLAFGGGKNDRERDLLLAEEILKEAPEYVFISLESSSKSRAAAKACYSALSSGNALRPVCFVSDGRPRAVREGVNAPIPVYIFEDISAESFHPSLNRMAFSADLCWGAPVNSDMRSAFEKFITDPENRYNYRSSVSFVLSIKYKLFSCGIAIEGDAADPKSLEAAGFTIVKDEDEAARVFSEKLLQRADTDENAARTIRSLIALEHRRWNLEKLCLGWRGLDGRELAKDMRALLRGSSERGKIYDKEKKIHHCIAFGNEDMPLSSPPYSSGDRSIWESPVPDGLDELDRISLMIHRHYMAIVRNTGAKRPEDDIAGLNETLAGSDKEIRSALKQFTFCLWGISAGTPGYAKQYDRLKSRLLNSLPKGAVREQAEEYIKNTDRFYFPFLQAYSYTDYKSLDSALVKNIPFILTYRICDEIVMPFCDGRRDDFRNRACFSNVASATVLRPQSVRYFYFCDDGCVTDEVKIKLDAVLKYFSRKNINCAVTFTILNGEGSRCGKKLLDAVSSLKGEQQCSSAYLRDAVLLEHSDAGEAAGQILSCFTKEKSSLFDGSAPLFPSCSQNAHLLCTLEKNAPCFEFDPESKRFSAISGCSYLSYVRDSSYITVSDMFLLMNAADISFEIPEFLNDYKKLWDIYSGRTLSGDHSNDPDRAFEKGVVNWTKLCSVLKEYFGKAAAESRIVLKGSNPKKMKNKHNFMLSADTENAARRLISDLTEYRLSSPGSSVVRETTDTVSVNIICNSALSQNIGTVIGWLTQSKKPVIRYNSFTGDVVIYPVSPDVKDLELSRDGDKDGSASRHILTELQNRRYISGLTVDDAGRASFSFTSHRIRELLSKEGEIAEIFVYCEALKTGAFDDIRKGFGFSWYGSRVENELDVVLTKGFCSMIIEVKAVERLDMNYYHKLHSLVSQFGIGSKAVIVNNDYRNNSFFANNNALQTERGNLLSIKTFSGREEVESIGEGLERYIKS